jgi:hypothetical protein
MEHARCIFVDDHPSGRRPWPRVVLDVHAYIVCGGLQVWVGVHRFCICLTKQALKHEWRAERIHDLRVACRLGARSNLPAASRNRRR